MSEKEKQHDLGCDDYHVHVPPRCCSYNCWCKSIEGNIDLMIEYCNDPENRSLEMVKKDFVVLDLIEERLKMLKEKLTEERSIRDDLVATLVAGHDIKRMNGPVDYVNDNAIIANVHRMKATTTEEVINEILKEAEKWEYFYLYEIREEKLEDGTIRFIYRAGKGNLKETEEVV